MFLMAFELIEKILARFKLAYAEAKKVSQKQKKENNIDVTNSYKEHMIQESEDNNEEVMKHESSAEHGKENLAHPSQK